MKISINWLKNYVNIDGIDVKDIVTNITAAGLEVETVTSVKPVNNLVIGYVKNVEKHPNADKLNVCTVFNGEKDLQIVCGAPNVAAGQTVVLANIGTVMPDGLKIKEAALRGVNSQGMICSERELGLSDEHNGILVLDDKADSELKPGTDANEVLGLGDSILEIGITPNRGDCLGIYGVARDVAAVFDRELKKVAFTVKEDSEKASDYSKVDIINKDGCPYFGARIIKGVKLGKSPIWMQKRLRSAGIRPINNVVDVTNYVMIEYGQPMHAYDLKVIDKGIVVRNAKKGEELLTLDGRKRALDDDILVIADHSKVLGVAGVMGGEYSGINDGTVDLLLECAYFNPPVVSAGAKKLKMHSDAAYRFVRGADAGNSRPLLNYAANLIMEVCGGKVLSGVLEDGTHAEPFKTVKASKKKICDLIGIDFSDQDILKLLGRLGMQVKQEGDLLTVQVPSCRNDIIHTASLAEEVARLYGVDNIPVVLPKFETNAKPLPPVHAKRIEIRHLLASMGFNETVNFSFMSKKYLSLFDDESKFVSLMNPLSEEMDTLRTVVYPGVINTMNNNWKQGDRSIRMFEFATSFVKSDKELPFETAHIAIGVMGDYLPVSWVKQDNVDVFYRLKGVVEAIGKVLGIEFSYKYDTPDALHPGRSAGIYAGDSKVGFMGAIHPDIEEELDLKSQVYIAELDYKILIDNMAGTVKYKHFSRLPYIYKDLSMIVPKNILMGDILDSVRNINPLVQDVSVFDRYTGKGIDDNEASVAFRIWFSSMEETLTDEQINPLLDNIIKLLSDKYGTKLR